MYELPVMRVKDTRVKAKDKNLTAEAKAKDVTVYQAKVKDC